MAERKMSRKWLEAMGIDADKIDVIVEAHSDALQSIKDERDMAVKARDEAEAELSKIDRTKDWKQLYEDAQAADKARETRAAKQAALREVYNSAGVAEKYHGTLLKVADYDKVELDAAGKVKNAAEITEKVKSEFADFIPTQATVNNQQTPTPPVSSGKERMSRDQILAITDRGERQKAIAENLDAFGY